MFKIIADLTVKSFFCAKPLPAGMINRCVVAALLVYGVMFVTPNLHAQSLAIAPIGDSIKVIDPAPGVMDLFGGAVSIQGNTSIVTALHKDLPVNGTVKSSVGTAYVYQRLGEVWRRVAALRADDGYTNDDFGYDVDIDAGSIIVGAWHADVTGEPNAGAAYVFTGSGSNWTQQEKLIADLPENGADFGLAVSIEGDIAVVGAHEADYSGVSDTGAAYVYRRSAGIWALEQVLHASVLQSNQAFGRSVSIHGGRIVVSAVLEDQGALLDGGALYVFDETGGVWSVSQKLVSTDLAASDLLGENVEIENDIIVATARDDDNGSNAGAGYAFEFDGATWQETGKLLASDGASGDRLGFRASISAGVVAIGSYRHNLAGNSDVGAAYLWQKSGGSWQQITKVVAPDGLADDNYAISVALSGSTLLVGSERDDHTGAELESYLGLPSGSGVSVTDAGSAYYHELSITTGDMPTHCNGLNVDVFIANEDLPTSGADVILGTSGSDTINSLGGNDTICSLGGNDTINAGNGHDWVDAGSGNDTVLGGNGNDEIYGDTGVDIINGGPDDDELYGEADGDFINGNSGDDLLDGGFGIDQLRGGSGDDVINTGSGGNRGSGLVVTGGAGNDVITGGPGTDEIRGESGNDTILGGDASDSLFGGGGNDVVNGQDGNDILRGNGSKDTVLGGDGNDDMDGGDSNDVMSGGNGNDVMRGSTGNDEMSGGAGNDEMFGGGGNDVINGNRGDDELSGGGSNDTLNGGSDTDSCDGEGGTDSAVSCESQSNIP